MNQLSNIDLSKLSINDAIRHESGHATMIYHYGYHIDYIVFGIGDDNFPFGCISSIIPENKNHDIIIKLSGILAMYINDNKERPSEKSFIEWTEKHFEKFLSGVNDFLYIQRIMKIKEGKGKEYYMKNVVLPYFDETCRALYDKRNDIDKIYSLLVNCKNGITKEYFYKYMDGNLSISDIKNVQSTDLFEKFRLRQAIEREFKLQVT